MKKTTKKILIIIVSVLIALMLGFALLIASMFGYFKTIPKPEITEGEFDFTFTYEVDGKTEVIEGTYVCKFEGINRQLDGMGRQWNGYIKDHDYFTDYEIKRTDDGVIMVDLDICSEFFMSDPLYKATENTDDPKPEPCFYMTSGNVDAADESSEIHFGDYEGDNVKMISFEYDPPIENTYK